MLSQTKTLPVSTNLDTSNHHADRLFFYCHQLNISVENLRDSINKYESYKENKKNTLIGSTNDRD
jgi:hypothetical protein